MLIYKIMEEASWQTARARGHYDGSADDIRDGFIHLSTAEQTPGTLRKHFSGQNKLLLAAVDSGTLGAALKWETSRGGQLFPHLYATLPVSAVTWCRPILLQSDGTHVLPAEVV